MKTYTCESCGKQFTDGGIVFKMDDHDAALCEDCAEIINVASWVLSPNSAKKIVLKDVINMLKKGLESFESPSSILEFELGLPINSN